MITTSHKPQAKRITTRTLYSSTDVTNFIKIKTQWTPASSLESLFFFIIKSNKQQASSLLSLYFFLFEKATSNKPAASSPVNA